MNKTKTLSEAEKAVVDSARYVGTINFEGLQAPLRGIVDLEGFQDETVYLKPTCDGHESIVQIDCEYKMVGGEKYIRGFTVSCAVCSSSFGIARK